MVEHAVLVLDLHVLNLLVVNRVALIDPTYEDALHMPDKKGMLFLRPRMSLIHYVKKVMQFNRLPERSLSIRATPDVGITGLREKIDAPNKTHAELQHATNYNRRRINKTKIETNNRLLTVKSLDGQMAELLADECPAEPVEPPPCIQGGIPPTTAGQEGPMHSYGNQGLNTHNPVKQSAPAAAGLGAQAAVPKCSPAERWILR